MEFGVFKTPAGEAIFILSKLIDCYFSCRSEVFEEARYVSFMTPFFADKLKI